MQMIRRESAMIGALFFFNFILTSATFAETPAEAIGARGLAIAKESDRRDTGFVSTTATVEMILKNRQGQESRRQVRVETLEGVGDEDKALSYFDHPPDVKGTALLTFSHKSASDDQWLYLPALKRVKRIASDDKSGSFMGSEFSYEDIAAQIVEKYTYQYLRDETYDGQAAFVISRDPVAERSGYSREVVWIDTTHYRVLKADYYDRKESLLKTLTFSGYRQYAGKFWRPDEMFMVNHQTGKSTRLKWRDYQFDTGLTDADFTQEALKRVR